MSNCYRYEKRNYDDPIFNHVDATYIINLENNGRITDIEEQLSKYHPSRDVFIVFNKGYKKCNKDEKINSTALDIIDTNKNILLHSIENEYDTILILEDDFQFSEKINEKQHKLNVDEFINENKNDEFLYYLGILPVLKSVDFGIHDRVFISSGMHACIFSDKMKYKILEYIDTQERWDSYIGEFLLNRYTYRIPLCYQLLPVTENSKTWSDHIPMVGTGMRNISRYAIETLEVDRKVEPGHTIAYKLSETLYIVIVLLLIYLVVKILYKILKKSAN